MNDVKQSSIVACCTARGVGAVALIRVSGQDAFRVVDRVAHLVGNKKISMVLSHTIHYGHVVHPQTSQVLDEVLFLVMSAPKTFTGFDTVEITSHGNPLVVQKIIDACIVAGARQAERGEFTRQALENNRIDLIQAEAIHELVVAQSEQSVDAALQQIGGALSQATREIEDRMVRLLAVVEASFEFVEEEQADLAYATLVEKEYAGLVELFDRLMRDCARQNHVRNGFRVACLGSVNAGKSTLFNALIGKNRSIVSDVAGTTRDVVDATIAHQGVMFTFVDTAGIRASGDVVEKIGIERSMDEAALADIVLLVVDATRPINQDEWLLYQNLASACFHKIILVQNKIDGIVISDVLLRLESLHFDFVVKVSALDGVGLDDLRVLVDQKITQLSTSSTLPFILNERHVGVISSCYRVVTDIRELLYPVAQFELIAMQLRDALEIFARMTGRNVTEKVLDQVFSTFCIGK